jgi:nitrate/TMAO reductase-like tetraheme cytochrome c subunit
VTPKHGHKIFLGAWAYVLGLAIALAAAVFRPTGLEGYTITVLAVFGIVVGLLNITDEEVLLFLVASLAFIVSASSVRAVLPENFELVRTLLHGIIIFTGAGAFVVAFKALFKVAKSE